MWLLLSLRLAWYRSVGGRVTMRLQSAGVVEVASRVAQQLPKANAWYAEAGNQHVTLGRFDGVSGPALKRWLDTWFPFPPGGVRVVCMRVEFENDDPAVANPYPIPFAQDDDTRGVVDDRAPVGAAVCDLARQRRWPDVFAALEAGPKEVAAAARDVQGWSLLHHAAWWGDAEQADRLVRMGVRARTAAVLPPPLEAGTGEACRAGELPQTVAMRQGLHLVVAESDPKAVACLSASALRLCACGHGAHTGALTCSLMRDHTHPTPTRGR